MTSPTVKQPPAVVLAQRLSAERLGPYVRAAGTLPDALRLYRWNGAVSAALFEDLGILEVELRNALDERLQTWHETTYGPGDWWDDPAGLLIRRGTTTSSVPGRASSNSRSPTAGCSPS